MLNTLKLKDFGHHKDLTVEFRPGINAVIGANGCVDANTLIYDPIAKVERRISDIRSPSHVLAYVDGIQAIAAAGTPFIKGVDPMFEVRTASGCLTVTEEHRFLTPQGWKYLRELSVGDAVLAPSSSSLLCVQSAHGADVSHSTQTTSDSRWSCSQDCRPCGEPPHLGQDSALGASPLQDGVPVHNQSNAHAGGSVSGPTSNHPDRVSVHLSKSGSAQPQTEVQSALPESRTAASIDGVCFYYTQAESTLGLELASQLTEVVLKPPQECPGDGPSRLWTGEQSSADPVGQAPSAGGGANRSTLPAALQPHDTICLGPGRASGGSPDHSRSFSSARESFLVEPIISINAVGSRTVWDIEVPGPANYIAGGFVNHNSGKSTILSGLRLALFGESFGAGKKEDDIRYGAKKARIELALTHQGADYRITREIGPGAKTTLRGAGQDLTSVKEVNAFIEKLFSVSQAVGRDNVFARQKSLDSLLDLTQGDRLRDLQAVFGLRQVGAAYQTLSTELTQYRLTAGLAEQQQAAALALTDAQQALKAAEVSRDEFQRTIQTLKGPAEATIQRALRCREAELRNQSAQAALQRAEALLCDATQAFAEARQKVTTMGDPETWASRLHILEASLAREQQAAVQAASRTSLQGQIQDGETALQALNEISPEALQEAQRSEAAARKALQDLEVEIASVDRRQDLVVLQDAIDRARQARDQLGAKPQPSPALLELGQRARDIQKTIESLKAGICGECRRPLAESAHDHAQALVAAEADQVETLRRTKELVQAEIAAFQASQKAAEQVLLTATLARGEARQRVIQELQLLRPAIQQEVQDAQILLRDLTATDATYRAAEQALQGLRDRLAAIPVSLATPGAIEDLQSQIRHTTQNLWEARTAVQTHQTTQVTYLAAERSKEAATRDWQALVGGGVEAPPTEQELEEAKQTQQKVLALTQSLEATQQAVGQLTAQVSSGAREVRRLTDQLAAEARDQAWVEVVSAARDALHPTQYPLQVMRTYVEIINARIRHHLGVLEARFRFWLDADEMQFLAEFPDGTRVTGARLSGAQRTIAAISFRLALSDTFASELGFVTLDEPTADMDRENVENFQRLLLNLKRDTAALHRQIIIITHEPSLMAFADHAIELT